MSEEIVFVAPPEVAEAHAALVAQERNMGNHDYAESFAAQQFTTPEALYTAYGNRDLEPAPIDPIDPPEPDAPELILGKFKSQEDLAAAYKALEAKLGAPKDAPTPKAEEGNAPKENELGIKEPAVGGFTLESLQAHYAEHGSLSEDHYKGLEKGGYSKEFANQVIQQLEHANTIAKSQLEQAKQTLVSQIYESVGGPEHYRAMTEWAAKNLSEAEIGAFNRASDSGDAEFIKLATVALKAKHAAAVGSGSTDGFVSGAAKASSGVLGFESLAQQTEAINDPRMQTSPKYREEVMKRIERATY